MTTADVNVSCPHCRQEYRLRIDLERLMRLRSRVVCSRCRKAFDVASRLGSARSGGRASVRPGGSVPPNTPRASSAPATRDNGASTPGPAPAAPEEAASSALVPPGTSLRAAVEIDARARREKEGLAEDTAAGDEPARPISEGPPYAPPDVVESVRTLPPVPGQPRRIGRLPLGAPPPPPPPVPRRPLGMPPPLPGGPPRRITPKMFAAVVDVAEVPVADTPAEKAITKPPPPIGPSSETPPPGPTQPTPESVAKWLALADPGLRALAPQRRAASEALERLVSG